MKARFIAAQAIDEHHAIQKEPELTDLLKLLKEEEPAYVLEIGADRGGTLWAWQQLKSVERVYAISLQSGPYSTGQPLETTARVFPFDSHDPATFDAVKRALNGRKIDFLFIDGDHTFEGVKRDLEMYHVLVREGGIIAFHDICTHPGMPDVGVDHLWAMIGGDKHEIVHDPLTWGGIGWFRVKGDL